MDIHNFIITFLVLILIYSIIFTNNCEKFTSYYIAQPTKCFSCEKELPFDKKYLGGPTKCFSCEKEIIARYGSKMADLAQPSKCFSCENQIAPNFLKNNLQY
tara:strand:+ start:234 stop:539 length:306 start_codon:yes stop_codon:yes gene_type:complete